MKAASLHNVAVAVIVVGGPLGATVASLVDGIDVEVR